MGSKVDNPVLLPLSPAGCGFKLRKSHKQIHHEETARQSMRRKKHFKDRRSPELNVVQLAHTLNRLL